MNSIPTLLPPPTGASSSHGLTDADLVARILAGDEALFELIMRRYNRLLYRAARAIVADDDEARDVVQATYVRAYYHLDQFRGPFGIQSWLVRIAVNEANGRRRRPAPVGDDEALDRLAAHRSSEPEQMAIDHEICGIVQRAIDRLPEDFRVVFMLRGVEQMSIAETAAALDIKEATVKTRFHRARSLLRASLGKLYPDAMQHAFQFDGSRCDDIVAAVLLQLGRSRAK